LSPLRSSIVRGSVLVFVFLLGMIAALGLQRVVMGMMFPPHQHGRMREMFIKRLEHDLNLSPAQVPVVDTLLRAQETRIQRVRGQMDALMKQSMDSLDTDLSKVLTPEQLKRMREERAKHGRHHRRPGFWLFPFMGPHGGPGDHDGDHDHGGPDSAGRGDEHHGP
jgi:hypothetical protein